MTRKFMIHTLFILCFLIGTIPSISYGQTVDSELKVEEMALDGPIRVYNQAYQETYEKDVFSRILPEAVDAYVLVDPDEISDEILMQLQVNGNQVAAYMNIGTAESWRSDFKDLKPFTSQNEWALWKDEYFYKSINNRLINLMKLRIDALAERGFDWVEFDNMDFAFDALNRVRYGIYVEDEGAIQYYQTLCTYAQEKGLKVMAKNTTRGAETFDGVTYESYEYDIDWWIAEELQTFLANGKLGIIVHYDAENPAMIFQTYREQYGHNLSFISESKSLRQYVHFN